MKRCKDVVAEERLMTSIGFGGGEAIEVGLSLEQARALLQEALSERSLLELETPNGETIVINPAQVKVLQKLVAPSPRNRTGGPR